MITNVNKVNPQNWKSFSRGDKYNDKINKLKIAGSINEYKKNYPNKETPVEYRERHQRNAEKCRNFNRTFKNYN
jgi:hypothetical protein